LKGASQNPTGKSRERRSQDFSVEMPAETARILIRGRARFPGGKPSRSFAHLRPKPTGDWTLHLFWRPSERQPQVILRFPLALVRMHENRRMQQLHGDASHAKT